MYVHIVFALKATCMSTSVWFASLNVIVFESIRVKRRKVASLLVDAVGSNIWHHHVHDGVFLKSAIVKDSSRIMVIIEPCAVCARNLIL